MAAVSTALLAAVAALLVWLQTLSRPPGAGARQALLVYCAASVQPAIGPIATAFEQQTAIGIEVQTGSSGALETQLRLSRKGDLYIPASQTPYLDRCQADGTVTDVEPLVVYRLVLAVHRQTDPADVTLDRLLAGQFQYAIANDEAAAGMMTRQVLAAHGIWPRIRDGAKVFLPTVTNVAQAVQQGTAVDCGFVWDTTAQQFGLEYVEPPELAAGRSVVAVGQLSSSRDRDAAERFLAFLTARDRGLAIFRKLGYTVPRSIDHDEATSPE